MTPATELPAARNAIEDWATWLAGKNPSAAKQLGFTVLRPGELTVYFAVSNDLLKVGSVGESIAHRMRQLDRDTESSWTPLVAVVGCDRSCEHEFHHLLSRWSVRPTAVRSREFFRYSVAPADLIARLQSTATRQAA